MGPNVMVFLLVMSIHRGDMLPQHQLPYLDALPLDYPHKEIVYHHYKKQVKDDMQTPESGTWWTCQAATRLFLQDPPLWDTDATAYLLGRMQGRNILWQPIRGKNGCWHNGWLDLHLMRQVEEEAKDAEPIPAPQPN